MKGCLLAAVALGVFAGFTANAAKAQNQDVCQILATRLQPDMLAQGSSSQQFMQLKRLVNDQRFSDWSNASSSSSSFNLGFSIPDIIDLAIGDSQRSNNLNWGDRRKQFLSMNFEETSSAFSSQTYLSQISVAALHEIVLCEQTIANSSASGVFVFLDKVTPNRDAFTVRLAYKEDGNSSRWSLTQFNVQPHDANFSCVGGYEHASRNNPIKLTPPLTREINCTKSPRMHLLLAVETTEGGATSIFIESIDQQIQKLRDDMTAQIQAQSTRVVQLERNVSLLSKLTVIGPIKIDNAQTQIPVPNGGDKAQFCALTETSLPTPSSVCQLIHEGGRWMMQGSPREGVGCTVTCIK